MDKMKISIKKMCCLYVSDWHLSVMLLPYINKQISEDVGITTIFKNDVEKNIKTLIEKLNLKNTEKILKINYKKNEIINYKIIEKSMDKIIKNKEIIIINNGEDKDIENTNKYIEEYLQKNKIENKNIKIINCYEVSDIRTSMDEILSKYKIMLNTSGEKNVEELFV